MWKNSGAEPGDALILTKPIGTGLVNTAAKADMVSETSRKLAIGQMRCLNYYASEILKDYEVHGCTDVTGFSLAGHALEMAEGSQVTIKIDTKKNSIFTGCGRVCQNGSGTRGKRIEIKNS